LMAYTPYGKAITVDFSVLESASVAAWWFNPRDGEFWPVTSFSKDKKVQEFKPHSAGRGSDWVLVLADARHKLAD
ncbi:MAG TPA: putative collagen-binding domain-containing protein, partial [Anseongella sp.]|nr:putative collagen-binding domain-containing protein [Anseongella sp.]